MVCAWGGTGSYTYSSSTASPPPSALYRSRRLEHGSTEKDNITYASCSIIQDSRREASCSLRLTVSSRRLISRSRSAILSSRSKISSKRTLPSFHQPGGVNASSLTTSLMTVWTGGGSNVACARMGHAGQGEPLITPPGAPARISASRRATSASRMATLLSRAMRACERLGVRTLHTPGPAGSLGLPPEL